VGEDAAALERTHSSLQPVLAQLGLVNFKLIAHPLAR